MKGVIEHWKIWVVLAALAAFFGWLLRENWIYEVGEIPNSFHGHWVILTDYIRDDGDVESDEAPQPKKVSIGENWIQFEGWEKIKVDRIWHKGPWKYTNSIKFSVKSLYPEQTWGFELTHIEDPSVLRMLEGEWVDEEGRDRGDWQLWWAKKNLLAEIME